MTKQNHEVGNVQLMQRMNRLKVIDLIRKKGPLSRPDIAKMTGLSPSSVTNIVSFLIERNLVAETGTVESRDVGRKAVLIRFNARAHRIISVNVEIDRVYVTLTDLDGEVYAKREIAFDRSIMNLKILDLIRDEITRLMGEAGQGGVRGIGLAVSGLVQDEGRFVFSSSLQWKGLAVRGAAGIAVSHPCFCGEQLPDQGPVGAQYPCRRIRP